MEAIFTWLTEAMAGAPWLAVLAAAGWGVASLVLSPCHLASIPLIVGFVAKRKATTPRQALGYALLFALGILVSIAAVGGATAAAGRMLGDVGPWANYVVAGVLAFVGLHLLGILPLPWERGLSVPRYQGRAAALLLGLIFGVALGPCTFAYMAPMLAVTFRLAATNLLYGILLLVLYGVGHCSVIVLAGTFTEVVEQYLHWNERSKGAVILKKICGVLVLLGGLYLVYTR
jgi:cytochrome c-type biogenesis protein